MPEVEGRICNAAVTLKSDSGERTDLEMWGLLEEKEPKKQVATLCAQPNKSPLCNLSEEFESTIEHT
jgi:hypothetical protein